MGSLPKLFYHPIRQGPNSEQQLSLPTFRQTPVSEFDGICILRMIFPTLFPAGKGDINLPRGQKITFEAWIRHLLRYKDGRFAPHPRFRYVVFNMLMRQKAKAQSSYLFSKHPSRDMSLEELQECVREGNDKELVNRISRASETLRGTEVTVRFW